MPDPDNPYFDGELWEELIGEIDKDRDQYIQFEKMSTREAFQVMNLNALHMNKNKNLFLTMMP